VKHMTGNRALLKLDGKIIGLGVQSVNFQENYGRQRIDGIGDGRAQELPVGQVSYTVSLDHYFISSKRLEDMGILPDYEQLLTSGGIDIELQDKVSKNTVALFTGCVIDSKGTNVPKFTPSGSNVTFQCLRKL
jgi:hypothetical protein